MLRNLDRAREPFFSVVTPAYNRAGCIGRAVDSCLTQTFRDFELLIVDDASTDSTVAVVKSYRDPRIRLIEHRENRGPCPARNTAIDAARGEWCVMLDTDFALAPTALERLRQRAHTASARIGNLASSCRWDTGDVSPAPRGPTRVLDYCGYVAWVQDATISEKLECIRRSAFREVRYPDSRAWEFQFHLDLARRWQIEISEEVLVTVFTDAANRLTTAGGRAAVQRVLADAPDKLVSFENILAEHGPELRRCAPKLYYYALGLSGHHAFLAGKRREGVRHLMSALRAQPTAAPLWGALAIGLLGRRATAWATVSRRQTSRV